MRKIWQFIKEDARHVFVNVISLVVCVGMVVVPSFYAWFNIAGSWDPYGNTKNLKVAVANADDGYTGELLPISLNMGQRMSASLTESKSIGYTVTDEDEAVEGVKSGKYYAAIVFPEDFTANMMSVLSSDPVKPKVLFYQNEKASAIGAIVTNKASTAVQQDIDESFAESVTNVGVGVLQELMDYLDDDNVAAFAEKLDGAVEDASAALSDTARNARSFGDIMASTQDLLSTSSEGAGSSLGSTADAGDMLRETAGNVRTLGDAVDGATDAVNGALTKSASSLDQVASNIDSAFDKADSANGRFQDGLRNAADVVDGQVAELDKLISSLNDSDTLYHEWEEEWDNNGPDSGFNGQVTVSVDTVRQLSVTVEGLNESVKSTRQSLADLSAKLRETADSTLPGVSSDTAKSRQEISDLVASAKSGISGVQSDYESNLKGSLSDLAGKLDGAASDADEISSSIAATLDSVNGTSQSAASGLGKAKDGLYSTADSLDEAATKLGDLTGSLEEALNSGDLAKVRAIISGGSASLSDFIAEPAVMDRTPIYAIENNGSAMAPFYTTLAIWIGGVVLAALVKTNASEKRMRALKCRHSQAYLGRIVFFVAIGFMQSLLITLGDLYFLQIQCEHPVLFILAGLLESLVFVNIIFALTASFGDVGKAIAVVLMVIQVAGSGGTFPVQMLPQGFFQAAYPWLPFVHAENAMRAAMFGIYNGDFWREMALLAAYLVPSLLLGLVLRHPVIKLNEWVEEKIESTKVM